MTDTNNDNAVCPLRARDSPDRVQIVVRNPLEGGRVGQGDVRLANRRRQIFSNLVRLKILRKLHIFSYYVSPTSLSLWSGLNLSEDDLVVNNFGDPRVAASAYAAPAPACTSCAAREAPEFGFQIGDRIVQAQHFVTAQWKGVHCLNTSWW